MLDDVVAQPIRALEGRQQHRRHVSVATCSIRYMSHVRLRSRRSARLLTATDLFAGAGGSAEGLRRAGLHVVYAANHNPVAVATHALNHPDTEHRIADLAEVDWRTFPFTDMLWASPSCVYHAPAGGRQRLSVAQEKLRKDAASIDRATAFAVIAAAEVHRYPVIIVENVPEFRSWVLYQWWLDGFAALGYSVQVRILNAADFGLPQRRLRYFAVFTQPGITVDLAMPAIAPVHAAAILDDGPWELVTRRLYVTPQIEEIGEVDVPHLVTYRRHSHARRADQYPLACITAGGNHHGVAMIDRRGRAWHRMLTNRECARGQGFPDSYEFTGTSTSAVKAQIGNAVAVSVAEWLGSRVCEALMVAAA